MSDPGKSQAFFPPKRALRPEGLSTHAASLHQAFAHCARSPTAASRRSLDRVSVPVWLTTLSGQLRIVGLVGHYPTNYLIRRGLILERPKSLAIATSGISDRFQPLFRTQGQMTHVLLTRPPLKYPRRGLFARLACVRRAASVRPEPGSNSPKKVRSCSLSRAEAARRPPQGS